MDKKSTKEVQYNDLLKVEGDIGRQQLGVMMNQVWHDDPRRLAFVLARYKFVSKMLSGKKKVAELGCGDAFGSRLVKQEVAELHVYDFDPIFVADIESRQSAKWPLHPHTHDILDGPLKEAPFDAIYSLDVMEHIEEAKEHLYIKNLKDSLNEYGTLIVGMPSLESQDHASPQSKIGHINCKSGKNLKAIFEKDFHNVFLFSMNDEVVHTGFAPMAHYLFVICTGKK